ncbi:unnamed protein product [Adineta steineri]|uniref:sphingosine kinase n=1 Tax=Adineta steineri TaxID=433720 RepID=A0A818LLJ2_9BILA|nr:unnamed protein product [Adineta steineri]
MTQEDSNIINLEDTFFLYGHSSKYKYLLKLSPTTLTITTVSNENESRSLPLNNVKIIPIDDIYGCLCMKPLINSKQCYLTFYQYVLRPPQGFSGIFSKKPLLHRSQHIFSYGKYNDYDTNHAEVIRWHRHIAHAIYLRRYLPLDIVLTKRDKRALVFVNPAGGAGKAYRLVMENVVGVWSEAEFSYQIVITEYAGHARDYVQSLDLSEWSGIVIASGDGLVYEVVNGLFSRNDWQEAVKMPIGHLPCGSGNAFAASIIRHSKQPIAESVEKFVVQSAILIATHQVLPYDMAVIDTCDGQRVFSFLSVEWAVIADVDCDSEKYRFLGGTRFTVEAVKRILRPRIYTGYIDYLPYDVTDDTVQRNQITSDTTTAQLHHHLLPLNEPISVDPATSKWRRIEGPFSYVLITSKSALSQDTVSTPQSTLADGYLTLQFIRIRGSTRLNLAKTLLSLSDGKHFEYDFVEWMPVRAFRIVPAATDGNLMIDGEKVPYGPLQGEVLPSIGRCMGKQPRVD